MYETAEDRSYDPDSRLAFHKSERSENLALVRQQKDLIYNQQAQHPSGFCLCISLFPFFTFRSRMWLSRGPLFLLQSSLESTGMLEERSSFLIASLLKDIFTAILMRINDWKRKTGRDGAV